MQVDFYHLAATPPARVIGAIAGRILGDGGRLLVVTRDAGAAEALDEALWATAPESFLPHGRDGEPNAARQPVLIGWTTEPANAARNIVLADGEWRDAALGFDRAFHLFDDATIAAARTAWKELATRDGVERRFWKQNAEGRWTQAA